MLSVFGGYGQTLIISSYPILKCNTIGESVKCSFYLAKGEMKEKKQEALRTNKDILVAGLDVCLIIFKRNLTDSTVYRTGEAGNIYGGQEDPAPLKPRVHTPLRHIPLTSL